ncbi:hypothetical protein C7Y44_24960 [Paenibacillus popilliae]|nr:hypothetical protein C7Y44_24960 [Paenibacillus sp. SDF0028]
MKKVLITMSMALFLFGSTGASSGVNLADIGSGWSPLSDIGSGWSVSDIGSGWSPAKSDNGSGWSTLDIGSGW